MPEIAELEKAFATDKEKNLLFAEDEQLEQIAMETDSYSERFRIACIAELLLRRFVSGNDVGQEVLANILTHSVLSSFDADMKLLNSGFCVDLDRELWKSDSSFIQRCGEAARMRLKTLFQMDGFIPVFQKSGKSVCVFLPFTLEPYDAEKPLIADAAGVPIAEWVKFAEEILNGDKKYRCVVQCYQTEKIFFSGNSMMLPLQLAVWRKDAPERSLFKYKPFKLIATGSLEHGILGAVSVEEKEQAFLSFFRNSFLMVPTTSDFHYEERRILEIPEGMSTPSVREFVQQRIESKGISLPTLAEAEKALAEIEDACRHYNISYWQTMLDRIATHEKACDPDIHQEPYLLCLMLRAAVYCHMGKTPLALQENRKALEYAKQYGFLQQMLRLRIEQIVELQDLCDFKTIFSILDGLQQEIDQTDSSDLKMRFYGTAGQVIACVALQDGSADQAEKARKYFMTALQFAAKIQSPNDVAQDRNYIHLWSVYFCPESEEELSNYTKAHNYISTNLQTFEKSQRKNIRFLYRQKMFSFYRAMLEGKQISVNEFENFLLSPKDGKDWLYALSCKYAGALYARENIVDKAAFMFSEAEQALRANDSEPVLMLIRMTIFAEAWRSLRKEQYRLQALETAEAIRTYYPDSIEKWIAFLKENAPFPGLQFWY